MHLWDVERIISQLRAGDLSEVEQTRYLIAGVILQLLIGRSSVLSAAVSRQGWTPFVFPAIAAIMAITGIRACARANARGDGRDLIARYVCLALPLTIRMYVLWAAAVLTLFVLTGYPGHSPGDVVTAWAFWMVSLVLYAGLLTWFFRRLAQAVARASGAPAEARTR